jgi:hypothetical protein
MISSVHSGGRFVQINLELLPPAAGVSTSLAHISDREAGHTIIILIHFHFLLILIIRL